MEDLIKRSDAINAVKRISENYTGKGKRDYHPHVDFIIDELKYCVPSADRPQGEWIDKGKNLWKCSNCGMVIYSESEQDRNEFHKWCGRCGCAMKGADDE